MPRKPTRREQAHRLLDLVSRGPSFSGLAFTIDPDKPPQQVASEAVKRWLDSWVAPLCESLVPEYREALVKRLAAAAKKEG